LTLSETGSYTGIVIPRRATSSAVLLVALATAAAAPLRAQTVQRSLYVSVLDAAGAPVPNLGPPDFIVREDNIAREVLHVAPADEPMQIALLVDNSQAARNEILELRLGLNAFIDAVMTPSNATRRNELALITLAGQPTIVTDYTPDRAQLAKGVDRLFSQPSSGACLLDALFEVSRAIRKRDASRPVIVAVTIEGPELSNRRYDQVLGPIEESGAAFYALAIGPPSGDLSEETRSREIVLGQGTRNTGGSLRQVLSSMALSPKLLELAVELTHVYRVTYARPQSLIPPDRVTVTTSRPGLTARGTLVKEPRKPGRP
jgi:hypothetical protein